MHRADRACRVFNRTYASHSKLTSQTLVEHAKREAVADHAPLAVRERRVQRGQAEGSDNPRKDGNGKGRINLAHALSPSQFANYQRRLVLGDLLAESEDGQEPNPKEWLDKLNEKRNRLRGVRIEQNGDGEKTVNVVGQKIYLPNVIFRLARNHTAPGEAYNPFEATFRIPQSLTKTDIRSYLLSVYGVETTFIRTDNYLSPLARSTDGSWSRTIAHKTYKRAVVGLVKPFYYPMAIEDMTKDQREIRLQWIEESFGIKSIKELRRLAFLRMTKKNPLSKAWQFRNPATVRRSQILKAVAEARARRELELEATKTLMAENREEGLPADAIDASQMRNRAELQIA